MGLTIVRVLCRESLQYLGDDQGDDARKTPTPV